MTGMVLSNAKVYTSDEQRAWATAVVIEDGVITYVGDDVGARENPDDLPVHDLRGMTIVPGFIDAHTHPSSVAQSDWHVRLPWTTDVGEILRFIREYAEAHPVEEAPFLYFEYYPTATFRDSQPTKELLDSAISDRPCLCQDFSEHEHWVNSKMLELMEVTSGTPDPMPGLEMFVRDELGEPTGLLREGVHRHFIGKMYDKIGWTPPEVLTPERLGKVFRFMTEHGVTALFEAQVRDEQALVSVAELERRGELNMYYEGSVRFRSMGDLPGAIARLKAWQARYGTAHINLNTLKLFLDGTNESGNSAVLAPLCDHAGEGDLGEIVMDAAQLADCLELSNSENVDVHIHLVGDRAFRVACDAVEQVKARLAETQDVWQIQVTLAHCELVDPADMPRPADLGIFINWTTHWSGGYFGDGSRKHLGSDRWNRMYRFNEIAQSGALVTFSSDVVTAYELHRADPFLGMQIAHTRIDPEYPLDPAAYRQSMRPEESARLPRDLLLTGYTINAARQLRLHDKVGSLKPGKVANLCILADDPFAVPSDQLSAVRIHAVLFEGNVVHGYLGRHGADGPGSA
jgi:predicted amidohydrolase YtcJ